MAVSAHRVNVFPDPRALEKGGNPTTIFLDAHHLTHAEMQELARACVHECGFVVEGPTLRTNNASGPACYDVSLQFWVPGHEMEMCGHATIGALWLIEGLGKFPDARRVSVTTKAGVFEALLPQPEASSEGSSWAGQVRVSQPRGSAESLSLADGELVAEALSASVENIVALKEIQNAATSRTKTLVPLKSLDALHSLRPTATSVRSVCEAIGSTGLYPYVTIDENTFSARQFPKSSGYLEDPATGIAATALVCGLLEKGVVAQHETRTLTIRQGEAMGRPSEIGVTLRRDSSSSEVRGYWLSGIAAAMDLDGNVLPKLDDLNRRLGSSHRENES
ncbi:unnamed protein product [Clonostachys byssicola]|uniref:Uncharacterized protein n=1 Tax=Clonostachys byssicola TaxID=160290 RepID=A0A9N9Y5E3_9HYPO|nr:unnamed protein product [Clonostachys byssicola]